ALMTLKYSNYAYLSKIFFFVIVLFLIVSGIILVLKKKDYRFIAFVPLILLIFAVGQFERVREFLRKPYTIHKYLYSNGIRESEAPFLNQSGVLKYAGWAKRSAKETDPVLRKGELLFKLECANCHTYNGVNGITKKKRIIQDVELTDNFLRTYKRSHPYMPPFIGTEEERQALAVYLDHLVNKSP
ncbi:hypothetical protein GF337_16980, partial [candidate division KSB1 bacterium]|nr:hypothetical protein [candidate division KSB1 bacterium]